MTIIIHQKKPQIDNDDHSYLEMGRERNIFGKFLTKNITEIKMNFLAGRQASKQASKQFVDNFYSFHHFEWMIIIIIIETRVYRRDVKKFSGAPRITQFIGHVYDDDDNVCITLH